MVRLMLGQCEGQVVLWLGQVSVMLVLVSCQGQESVRIMLELGNARVRLVFAFSVTQCNLFQLRDRLGLVSVRNLGLGQHYGQVSVIVRLVLGIGQCYGLVSGRVWLVVGLDQWQGLVTIRVRSVLGQCQVQGQVSLRVRLLLGLC